jgi:hypothetical protein
MPDFQENPQQLPSSENPSGDFVKNDSHFSAPTHESTFHAESEGGWSQQTLAKKPSLNSASSTHDEFEEFSFDDLSLPQLPSEKRTRSIEQQDQRGEPDPSEKTATSVSSNKMGPPPPEAIVIKTAIKTSDDKNDLKPDKKTEIPFQSGPQPSPASLSEARVEEILREEVRMILQRLCTKLVPEIAERAVKEEIQKILSTPPPGV